jgi:hypothetical protein
MFAVLKINFVDFSVVQKTWKFIGIYMNTHTKTFQANSKMENMGHRRLNNIYGMDMNQMKQ